MKRIFIAMAICIASISGQAAEAERYVGKRPQQLLKLPEFAKAYRAATRNVELPAWTKRLGTGQSAEIIAIGGNKWILASACSKNGCQDERIYILFDPENKSANGFFSCHLTLMIRATREPHFPSGLATPPKKLPTSCSNALSAMPRA